MHTASAVSRDCKRGTDSVARLFAYPMALRCFDCQRVHEKTFAHPPELKL